MESWPLRKMQLSLVTSSNSNSRNTSMSLIFRAIRTSVAACSVASEKANLEFQRLRCLPETNWAVSLDILLLLPQVHWHCDAYLPSSGETHLHSLPWGLFEKGNLCCLSSLPLILPIFYPHPKYFQCFASTLPYLRGNGIASTCYIRSHSLHHSLLQMFHFMPMATFSLDVNPSIAGCINCYNSSRKPSGQHTSKRVKITHPPAPPKDVSSSSLQNPQEKD